MSWWTLCQQDSRYPWPCRPACRSVRRCLRQMPIPACLLDCPLAVFSFTDRVTSMVPGPFVVFVLVGKRRASVGHGPGLYRLVRSSPRPSSHCQSCQCRQPSLAGSCLCHPLAGFRDCRGRSLYVSPRLPVLRPRPLPLTSSVKPPSSSSRVASSPLATCGCGLVRSPSRPRPRSLPLRLRREELTARGSYRYVVYVPVCLRPALLLRLRVSRSRETS